MGFSGEQARWNPLEAHSPMGDYSPASRDGTIEALPAGRGDVQSSEGGGWLAGLTVAEDGFLEEVMSLLSPEGCWLSQVTGCCRGRGQETRSGAGAESRGKGEASAGAEQERGHWLQGQGSALGSPEGV